MTVGAFQDILIRFPSITEKQRGFTITVPFDRLDKLLCLFLGPFPMMHRMNQPTARQDVDKRPSIAQVLSLAFVVAEPGFFLRYSDVVFWRVPSELTSRHAPLLLGKQIAKEIFRFLPELESFVHIQDQRLHKRLGLLTTRFPNGFEG